jgi:hypothetical protein
LFVAPRLGTRMRYTLGRLTFGRFVCTWSEWAKGL